MTDQQQNVLIRSECRPGMKSGQKYRFSAKQEIHYFIDKKETDDKKETVEETVEEVNANSFEFRTTGSALLFDQKKVDSFYPANGTSDLWYVLPHLVFNDAEFPWTFASDEADDGPVYALLAFEEGELASEAAVLSDMSDCKISFDGKLIYSSTQAITMPYQTYLAYTSELGHWEATSSTAPTINVDTIFLSTELFSALFERSPKQDFNTFCHVRSSDRIGDLPTKSVIVSSRFGPSSSAQPATMRVHLILLPRPRQSTNAKLRALISLFSWSYSCVQSSGIDLTETFRNLSIQTGPLCSSVTPNSPEISTAMHVTVQARLSSGFGLFQQNEISGESKLGLYQGLLTPRKVIKDIPSDDALKSADDLVEVDTITKLTDHTYQIAWELGRSMAIANAQITTSILKLRSLLHNAAFQAVREKILGSEENATIPGMRALMGVAHAMKTFSTSTVSLLNRISKTPPSNDEVRPQKKWAAGDASNAMNRRERMAKVLEKNLPGYVAAIDTQLGYLSSSASPSKRPVVSLEATSNVGEGLQSVDFGQVAQWVSDKLLLKGIPWQNLMADPDDYLPMESVRTFHVNSLWLELFTTGALSIGETFTKDDDVRLRLKDHLRSYLKQALKTGPPMFGMFIRSRIVDAFPSLQIIAPNISQGIPPPTQQLICKSTLIELFYSDPSCIPTAYPKGIALIPPMHQLCFQLGSGTNDDWKFDDSHRPTSLKVQLNETEYQKTPSGDTNKTASGSFCCSGLADGIDFVNRIVNGPAFIRKINETQKVTTKVDPTTDSSSSLLASQLIGRTPFLCFTMTIDEGDGGAILLQPNKKDEIDDLFTQPIKVAGLPSSLNDPKTIPAPYQPVVNEDTKPGEDFPEITAPAIMAKPYPQSTNAKVPETTVQLEFLNCLASTNCSYASTRGSQWLSYDHQGPIRGTPHKQNSKQKSFLAVQLYNIQSFGPIAGTDLAEWKANPNRRHLYAVHPSETTKTDIHFDIQFIVDDPKHDKDTFLNGVVFYIPIGASGMIGALETEAAGLENDIKKKGNKPSGPVYKPPTVSLSCYASLLYRTRAQVIYSPGSSNGMLSIELVVRQEASKAARNSIVALPPSANLTLHDVTLNWQMPLAQDKRTFHAPFSWCEEVYTKHSFPAVSMRNNYDSTVNMYCMDVSQSATCEKPMGY